MPKIQILTAQKVSIEYDTATWIERTSAFVIDFVIILLAGVALYNFNYFEDSNTGDIIYYLVFGLVLSTYTLWNEFFFSGITIGKKILKIKVMRLDGEPPSFGDYFGRWMFRIIDIYFSSGMLATFLVTSTGKAQRTGDMISNTVVIRNTITLNLTLNEILKLATMDSYQPVYEHATRLTEEEMLIIKETIDRQNMYSNTAHEEALDMLFRKVAPIVGVTKIETDKVSFFKTLIKDYIVLTR